MSTGNKTSPVVIRATSRLPSPDVFLLSRQGIEDGMSWTYDKPFLRVANRGPRHSLPGALVILSLNQTAETPS